MKAMTSAGGIVRWCRGRDILSHASYGLARRQMRVVWTALHQRRLRRRAMRL